MDFYLLSSASLDLYPNNTLVSFTNKLPKPLHFPINEKWALSVQYITITAKFRQGYERNIIKIECDQVKETIDGNGYSRVIGIFAYQCDQNGLCYYEFLGSNYHLLENSYIDNITIRLLDEKNKPIILDNGNSTLLKFHMKKMEYQEDYILHVNSKPTTEFPNNVPRSFTCKLPKELTLYGNWKVALTSITYPPLKKNFFSENQYVLIKYRDIRNAYVYNIDKNITSMRQLKDRLYDVGKSTRGRFFFSFNPLNQLTAIVSKHEVAIAFSTELKLLLNLKDYYVSKLEDIDYYVKKENEVTKDNGQAEGAVPEENGIKFLHPGIYGLGATIDDDYSALKYLFVYADFIDKTILGSSYVPILKIIPLSEQAKIRGGQPTSYNFPFREYYNVTNTHLTHISFRLSDEHGGDLLYKNTSDIYLTIRLRLFK